MEEKPTAISEIELLGASPDGQGVGFGFRTSQKKVLWFKCATDGLEDILNNLVTLYDLANERRGFQPKQAGESGVARMHQIVATQPGVTEHGMALLTFRTSANTYHHLVFDMTQLAALDTAIQAARSATEGMAQQQKH